MAVIQLASRTGADVKISFHPMVEEVARDLILGESIETFLPDTLKRHLPDGPLSDERSVCHTCPAGWENNDCDPCCSPTFK